MLVLYVDIFLKEQLQIATSIMVRYFVRINLPVVFADM